MALSKRDTTRIERNLVATLTEACETAKAEIPGFEWLTHTVNYDAFPASLRVIWVFDTQANKDHALASGQEARMRDLTALALTEADLSASAPVYFDCEEACQLKHGGDWRLRLAKLHTAKG
ncbi:hypothetical protein DYL59_21885 [Pseudomonas kairouanensis]|uniref:Fis family transcriptional regulator n=1 Tax=Pseudomonas kairouanensis TaxID=2293832 RepID=A0A4Z0AKT6_9PSED|nr:hypothetical protein [Pseudomonas kairouanensis]TFY86588.1 hypothetical protein DYL59_21885 [Pseudomonas kairouanensis]